jgi:RNA polymerase primary sigma factor
MKKLKLAMSGFTVSSARQHMNKGLSFEELIEAGTEGLRRAAMEYDLDSDTMFYIHGDSSALRVPLIALSEYRCFTLRDFS